MALLIYENVFEFQVPVNNPEAMQFLRWRVQRLNVWVRAE